MSEAAALISVLTVQPAIAQTFVAPNRIDVSPTITTSGQPTADTLSALRSLGYRGGDLPGATHRA